MKKILISSVSLILSLMFLFSLSACKKNTENGQDTVVYTSDYMVKNGISPYKVVIPAAASDTIVFAANDFVMLFKEATGVDLPIVRDNTVGENDKFISIGETAQFEKSGLEYDSSLGYDGLNIYRKDKNHYLIGGSEEGTCYAVYEYFERLFDLKIFTDTLRTMNTVEELKLADFDVSEKPDIPYRLIARYNTYWGPNEYTMRMRVSNMGQVWALFGHSFAYLMPPSQYFADHPEWYTVDNPQGEWDWQLCTSNTEMRKVFVDNVIEKLKSQPQTQFISISLNDGYGMCGCADCADALKKYGTWSGVYIEFGNYVASEVKKWLQENDPERAETFSCSMLAYNACEAPPYKTGSDEPTIKCVDNMHVMYAPVADNRAFAWEDEENSAKNATAIKQWLKVTDHLDVWSYSANFANFLQPYNMWNSVQQNYKDFVARNGMLWYEEGTHEYPNTNFTDLKLYVESQLMWDTDQDINVLIDDFMNAFYGPKAAPYIREYFDVMNMHFLSSDEKNKGRAYGTIASQQGHAVDEQHFPYGFVYNCNEIFKKAIEANEELKDTENYQMYSDNIKIEQLVVTYLFLELHQDRFDTEEVIAMLDEFEKYGELKGISYCGGFNFDSLVSEYRSQI